MDKTPEQLRREHPIWVLYDEIRTAQLNIFCLQWELRRLQRLNTVSEILITVGSAASIASLSIWNTEYGRIAWGIVGGVSVFAKVVKPVFRMQNKIAERQQLLGKFQMFSQELELLRKNIETDRVYDAKYKSELQKILKRYYKTLTEALKNFDPPKSVIAKCAARVKQAMPESAFFVPENPSSRNQDAN